MATRKTAAKKVEEEVPDNIFVSEKGITFECKKIDPVFLQSVINSVEMPEVPTYEAKVGLSGRTETHRMDAEAAKQTEGGEELWKEYITTLAEANSEQTEISLRAMFLEGTVIPEGDYLDPNWVRRMKIMRVKLEDDPEALWVQYLSMNLTSVDIVNLSSKIMRLIGVEEEIVQEAEGSFRDSILPESEG